MRFESGDKLNFRAHRQGNISVTWYYQNMIYKYKQLNI